METRLRVHGMRMVYVTRPFHSLSIGRSESMSSIRRDVKKKLLPRPEGEKILVLRPSPLPIVPSMRSKVFLCSVCSSSHGLIFWW